MPYGTRAGFIAYAALRGTTVPDTVAADQALARASDYIRTRYLIGTGATGEELEVIEATYIAARYELAKVGFFATTYTPGTAKVLTEVKGIRWQVIGTAKGATDMEPVVPAIEALLAVYAPSRAGPWLRAVG